MEVRGVWLVVAFVLLAGCQEAPPPPPPAVDHATIEGWLGDEAFVPVVGASVRIAGGNATETDEEGHYRLDVAPGQAAVLVAQAEGHMQASTTLVDPLPGRNYVVNLTLPKEPDAQPYREVNEFRGFISCGLLAQAGHQHGGNPHQHNDIDCGGGNTTQQNVWLAPARAGLTGAVFEVFWEANTPLAEDLVIFVEGVAVEEGEDVMFSFYEGRNGMKGTVSHKQALKYLHEDGGTIRFTIKPGASEDDVAAGVHVNQEYEVIATLFYGEAPPADYRFGGAA